MLLRHGLQREAEIQQMLGECEFFRRCQNDGCLIHLA